MRRRVEQQANITLRGDAAPLRSWGRWMAPSSRQCGARPSTECRRTFRPTLWPTPPNMERSPCRSSSRLRDLCPRRLRSQTSRIRPCRSYVRVVRATFLLILPHLRRSPELVAPLLVKLGFCRIRFWYLVASASGISREISRIYFWNLTSSSCTTLPSPSYLGPLSPGLRSMIYEVEHV
jgi:hypothetical protein